MPHPDLSNPDVVGHSGRLRASMSINSFDHATKFRNAAGTRYTKGLFLEESMDKSTVLYTLRDREYQGYPSLYELYILENDPLEWNFARKYFDGWEHWLMVCDSTWFKPYIQRWREELELKVRSESLLRLIKDSESTSRSAAASNKFLLEKGWKPKALKGRPSKHAIRQEAERIATAQKTLDDDLARLLPQ